MEFILYALLVRRYKDNTATPTRHAADTPKYRVLMTYMTIKNFTLLLMLILCATVHANTAAQHVAKDCKEINQHAQAGLVLYQKKQYAQARVEFEQQVAWLEICRFMDDVQFSDKKIATAYNNVALSYLRQVPQTSKESTANWLKAFAWLNLAPSDSKSQYNLKQHGAEMVRLHKQLNNRITGTYWQYAGQAMWNTITISKKSKEQYQLDFSGFYATPNSVYYGPNMGELSVNVRIKQHQATFASPEFNCKYALTFTAQGIYIKRVSGAYCGFGHNVAMQGDYVRVSP